MRSSFEFLFYLLIYLGIGANILFGRMNNHADANKIGGNCSTHRAADTHTAHFLIPPESASAVSIGKMETIALVPVITEALETATEKALTDFTWKKIPKKMPLRIPVFTAQNLFLTVHKMRHSVPAGCINGNILVYHQQ